MANSKDPDDMAPQTLGASTVGRKKLFEDIMEPIRLNRLFQCTHMSESSVILAAFDVGKKLLYTYGEL